MMKTSNAAICAVTGVVLLAGNILTTPAGLSDEDISCYKAAVALQNSADEIGFPDFYITDYPIAFCDGKYDYVLTSNGGGYDTEKRSPVIETLAATAYENGDHFEVIVPTKGTMKTVSGIMGAKWDEQQQVCTIWHEAFHCRQFTYFRENIERLTKGHSFEDKDFGEPLINSEYSANPKAKELFTKQLELLSQAQNETDIDKIRDIIVQYKETDEQRTALLSEEAQILENYYTIVEGTAYYVEMRMCRVQDENRCNAQYADRLTDFSYGSAKFYALGGAQCLLLDKIDVNWKADYDFSVPLSELIYKTLGV